MSSSRAAVFDERLNFYVFDDNEFFTVQNYRRRKNGIRVNQHKRNKKILEIPRPTGIKSTVTKL